MNNPTPLSLIGGRWAVSLRVWVLMALLMQVPSIARASDLVGHPVPSLLLPGACGALGLGAVLLVTDLTVLRNRRIQPVNPWLVLGIWVLAGVARFMASELVIDVLVPEAALFSITRLVATTISVLGWIWLFTYYFALSEHYRQVSADLLTSTLRLRDLTHRQIDDAELLRETLAESVETAVLPALRHLEAEVASLSDASSQKELIDLSERAGGYSRQLVREVSHQISLGETAVLDLKVVDDVTARDVEGRHSTRWTISLGWGPIVFASSTLPLAASNYGAAQFTRALIGFVVWYLVLVIFRRAQDVIISSTHIASALYVVLANICAIPVAIWAQYLVGGMGFTSRTGAALLAFWSAALLAGLITSAMAHTINRLRSDNQLIASLNERAAEISSQMESTNDRLRKQVASVLHGPVQGRLAAVALSLRLYVDAKRSGHVASGEATFKRCRALLEQVNRDIAAISAGEFESAEPIADQLEVLVQRWAGLIRLDVHFDPSVESIIDRDPALQRRVFSIAEEAVNNACSHGRARNVALTLDTDSGDLVVAASDDGVGVPDEVHAGLGLSEIAAQGGSWTLEAMAAGGSQLRVRLPLGAAAPSTLAAEAAISG